MFIKGNFVEGKISGIGKMTYSNGEIYEGKKINYNYKNLNI